MMKKIAQLFLTSAILCGGAALTVAQDAPPPHMPPGGFGGGRQMQMQMPSFAELDKNKDQKLSKSEMPEMMANFFDRLDENKDGFVDETEWNNAMNRFRGGAGGGPRFGEALMKFLDANADQSVSVEEFANLESLFDNLDQDKSGDLSLEELNRFFQAVNQHNNPQAQHGNPPGGGQRFQPMQFADLDKNKDGKLARNEFPEPMAQAFDRFDENKDGFVDEAEWKKFMQRPRLGEALAKFLDTDHDAKISRAEFAQIKSLFARLDKDKNGALVSEELNQFNQAATEVANEVANQATGGVDVNQLFANLDKNKDGKITPDELTSEKSFHALDLNKDGEITKEEATAALKKQAELKAKMQSKSPQQ
ncbi:MAG: EF-hand domain-containing protein [Acidobacteria bacterium]|nr:EF-hand domain-containing protein [Acidobacteriota bacterium]